MKYNNKKLNKLLSKLWAETSCPPNTIYIINPDYLKLNGKKVIKKGKINPVKPLQDQP